MKQPKKLTRDQKELLNKKGMYNPSCRLLSEDEVAFLFVDISTGEQFWVEKEIVAKKKIRRDE